MTGFNVVIICAIGALILYILGILLFSGKDKKGVEQRRVQLSEIAQLWARSQQTGEIHIKDIAPLWRKSALALEMRSEYVFRFTKVADFFRVNIEEARWFDQADAHKEICYQILQMLEREGECPSVVNTVNDVESSWDSNTYELLGKTTLLDHSLNVAGQVISLLIQAEAHHVIPDALIAALGHDLGKLPSNRSHLYSLGEHPLAAGRVLAEIELFKNLSRKEDLVKAIKQHHMRPDGLLGKTLKKADQKARQKELEEAVALQATQQGRGPGKTVAETVVEQGRGAQHSSGSARQADADIYGGDDENAAVKNKKNLQPVNISAWFDARPFLDALRPYINRVQGRRFVAFSMPNGYVYFQVKAIEEVIREQAKSAGAMDIATMSAKDPTMQRVLFSVVEKFRAEHDLIAQDMIKKQYFGGYFTISMKGGKATMKGYYTPFKAEAFGSIAEMENEKKGFLRNFTSVDAYTH